MTDSLDQPQRQSPIAIVANVFNVQALQALVPVVILGFGRNRLFGLIALPLALVALVGFSALAWSRTRFWVENGEMVLEKGVLNKSRTQIPLDRIQQIGTEQGVVQQLFNVRSVTVDSAGTSGSEFSLAAVTDDVVAALRARVVGLDKAGTAAAPEAPPLPNPLAPNGDPYPTSDSYPAANPESTSAYPTPFPKAAAVVPTPGAITPQEDRRTMVLRHEFADLVQLAVSRPSPQVVFGLLALGGLGLGSVVERFLAENITGVVAAVILGVVLILAGVAVLLIGTMIREFQLTVWRSQEGLRLTAGLLTKRERIARTERVQFVRQRRNPIERFFKRTSVYLPQASAVQVDAANATGQFSIPGAPDDKATDITELFLSQDRPEPTQPIDRRIVNRKTLLDGILPAAILGVIAVVVWQVEEATNWFVLPLLIGAAYVIIHGRVAAVLFHRYWGWNIGNDQIVLEHGFVNVERTEAALRKVQSVRIRQGLWQRRKRLASVQLGTAGGSFTIPHISLETAQDLRDHILARVETDIGAWM